MTRIGQAAIDYTMSRVGNGPPPPAGMPDSGLCLAFTRDDFAVAALHSSAINAWNASPTQHPGDRNPPPAVPVWFWTASPYRHVAFHTGGGQVVSTYNDDVRVYASLAEVERVFGGPYMGYAYDINGVTIYYPDDGTSTPGERERTMELIRGFDKPEVYITDGIYKRHVAQQNELTDLLDLCGQTEPRVMGQYTVDRFPVVARA